MFIKVHNKDIWFNSTELQEVRISYDRIRETYKVIAFVKHNTDSYTIFESKNYDDCKDFVATLMVGLNDVAVFAK